MVKTMMQEDSLVNPAGAGRERIVFLVYPDSGVKKINE
jgi:hypothetical protein